MVGKKANTLSEDFVTFTDCYLLLLLRADSHSKTTTIYVDIYCQKTLITYSLYLYEHLGQRIHVQMHNPNNTGILL
jgi:hypothetical protein